MSRVVAVGGGTGLPILLKALTGLQLAQVTALVNVADDGGSSGRLREALGILPPGDLRNCLTACAADQRMANLFSYRFKAEGELHQHSLGNLILAALYAIEGDFLQGIQTAAAMLGVRAEILPASTQPLAIAAYLADGRQVLGQAQVAQSKGRIVRLELLPVDPPVAPQVLQALEQADHILIGPGSLYSSILPVLLIPAVARSLRRSSARVTYICNTMSFRPETLGYTAEEHLVAIEGHIGDGLIDFVLANDPASLNERTLARASELRATPVRLDVPTGARGSLAPSGKGPTWILASLADDDQPTRHSCGKLEDALRQLLGSPARTPEESLIGDVVN